MKIVKPVLNSVAIKLRDVKMKIKVGLKFGSSTFFLVSLHRQTDRTMSEYGKIEFMFNLKYIYYEY